MDLCVTIFDAVFDFNLKWSDLLTTQLCCTSFEIACFDPTRRCMTIFRVRQKRSSQSASQVEKVSVLRAYDLHSLSQKLAEAQAKVIELERRIDALHTSAANATAATDHRVAILQSATENATRQQ